jgi:hypothetical protein
MLGCMLCKLTIDPEVRKLVSLEMILRSYTAKFTLWYIFSVRCCYSLFSSNLFYSKFVLSILLFSFHASMHYQRKHNDAATRLLYFKVPM